MAELVFWLLRKITHADWLLNGLMFYDNEPTCLIRFLLGALGFGGKIFELIMKSSVLQQNLLFLFKAKYTEVR